MSTFQVTVEQLQIHPHPNADALELAQVGLYRAIVPKGVYQSGEYAVYIPEQAILPADLITELGLDGRLAGREKNRVKAIRLRGELSQGIVCRPKLLSLLFDPNPLLDGGPILAVEASQRGLDYQDELDIHKWAPPIPVHLAGKTTHAPNLVKWVDIENIKRYPDIFAPGEPVVATEKIHGTCCLFTYDAETGTVHVASKGIGAQQLSLLEEPGNLYWRAAKFYDLEGTAAWLSGYLAPEFDGGVRAVGLFGEIYGKGVQDLHYGKNAGADDTIGYALFDVAVVDGTGRQCWLSHPEVEGLWSLTQEGVSDALSVPRAPVLYQGPYDYAVLATVAEGKSLLHPGTIREGVVVRPVWERHSQTLGGRAIGKIVSAGYLTRGGDATEYE